MSSVSSPISRSGPLPLGYTKVAGQVVFDHKAELVERAFQLAGQGKSLRSVLELVTAEGLTGQRGELLGLSTLQRILANNAYTGDGLYPPLISKTRFTKVRRQLRQRRY